MENISIKDYIINNFKNDSQETLKNAIDECIKEKDEETLPGMGVFLELIWANINNETKNILINALEEGIKKAQ